MIWLAVAMSLMRPVAQDTKMFEDWGRQTIEAIRREYYRPEPKLYAEAVGEKQNPNQVAFNWSVGVTLSALNGAARLDPKYKPWLREYADASHVYWNPKPPVAGYDVLPSPKPVDRYYDDNAWMVMTLVETYELLGDAKYLTWARETLRFVLSGEDGKLGGGIYWKEAEKSSKNTCSNAPSAAACLAVYRHTHEPALLDKARELYTWTKRNLMDPSDHLFWDNIGLSGRIEKTKWSYNTALMIRTATYLYKATKLPSYREDALAMEKASIARWFKDGKMDDPGRFAHLLMESWMIRRREIPEEPGGTAELVEPLRFLHDQARSPKGVYPDRWTGPTPKDGDKAELIDQSAVARAFFEVAAYLRK